MNLPFTRDAFFDVFARYNEAVWPLQVLWIALAFAALGVLHPGTRLPFKGRVVAAWLAGLWAWMGVAFHMAFFSAINSAAWAFGLVFVAQSALLLWLGCRHDGLRPQPAATSADARGRRLRSAMGWALIVYAMLVYPAIGFELGHRYPATPTFGLPCPGTIYTIGVLLLAGPGVSRWLFVLPALWSAVGSVAAFTLGVTQDLMLLAAGAIALWAIGQPASTPQGETATR